MECGLGNPATAGRQQRYFALHPPWSPWLFNFSTAVQFGAGPSGSMQRMRSARSDASVAFVDEASIKMSAAERLAYDSPRIPWLIR